MHYSSIAIIWGTSDKCMWKANDKKNRDYAVGGWLGHVKQKSGGKVEMRQALLQH
ncbi:hypothetical protein [Bacillus sp. mrc49]|uniref:hypothetical protein n=1 Tax=Bacillus sp. mrc49 TaxID=2054913 RepID=UPI0012FDA317|nr:hypothetical protein [Bacillus sp. mrc49]